MAYPQLDTSIIAAPVVEFTSEDTIRDYLERALILAEDADHERLVAVLDVALEELNAIELPRLQAMMLRSLASGNQA